MADETASWRARTLDDLHRVLDADIAKMTPGHEKKIKQLLDSGLYPGGVVPQFQAAVAQAANADADDIPDRQYPEIIIAPPHTLTPATEKIFIQNRITRFGIRVTENRWYMIREEVANEKALFNELKIHAEQIVELLRSRVNSDYLEEIKFDWNEAQAKQRHPDDIARLKAYISSQIGDQEISGAQLDQLAIQYARSNYESLVKTFGNNEVLRHKFIAYTQDLGLWTTDDDQPQLLFEQLVSLYDKKTGVQIYPPEHQDYKTRMGIVKKESGFYPECAILEYKWSAAAFEKDANVPAREIAEFRAHNRMIEVRKLERDVLQISDEEKEGNIQPDANIVALRQVLSTKKGELNEAGVTFFSRLYGAAPRPKEGV